jgi:hypothetical protein
MQPMETKLLLIIITNLKNMYQSILRQKNVFLKVFENIQNVVLCAMYLTDQISLTDLSSVHDEIL